MWYRYLHQVCLFVLLTLPLFPFILTVYLQFHLSLMQSFLPPSSLQLLVPQLSWTDHLVQCTHVNYNLAFSFVPCLSRSTTHGLSLEPFPLLHYHPLSTRTPYDHLYHHLTVFPSLTFYDLQLLGPVS